MIMDVVGGSAVLSSDSVLCALELTFRDLSAGVPHRPIVRSERRGGDESSVSRAEPVPYAL
jgi:hypothetical protein